MHPLTTDLAEQIFALIKLQAYSLLGAVQDNKVVLGGSAGSSGGLGEPPAGFVGQLTQSNVTYDTAGSSRACSAGSAGSSSLVDNLDLIRLGTEICDDAIGDRHIDWGHAAEQVDAEDVPLSSGSLSSTNVHDALEELYGLSAGSAADHGTLTGLADDDHTQYLLAGGTRALSGAWDVGAHLVTFGAGIMFDGASGANIVTVPDNVPLAWELWDDGGVPIEYMRIVSTDANPYFLIDPAAAGIYVGVGTQTPVIDLDVRGAGANTGIRVGYDTAASVRLDMLAQATQTYLVSYNDDTASYAELDLRGNPVTFSIGTSEKARVHTDGNFGVGCIPSTRFDIGAGAFELDEMAAPGGGAANTCRIYAVDNGGKTELLAIFNTGVAQQLAIEP